jgi:hypothetical protein
MARTSRPVPDSLDRILFEQLGVIARHQVPATGLTDSALRHRLRPGGPWRTLLPGVFMAATGTPTPLQEEMAALLYAGTGSMVTGMAALRCHHIGKAMPDLIDVLVPAARQRRDTGFVRLHRTGRMPERIWERGPIRYVPPARAVADTARGLASLRDVRAVVADAVQRRACQVRDLAAELDEGPRPGSALFKLALADVAGGIRSVAEADLKDLLVKAKIPIPLFNPALYDKDGTFIARPDAWWPELGIAIEVDSREWHLSPEDHASTLARGRRMSKYQIVVLRFTPGQIRSDPASVIRDITEALAGARGRPPLNLRTVPADKADQAGKADQADQADQADKADKADQVDKAVFTGAA